MRGDPPLPLALDLPPTWCALTLDRDQDADEVPRYVEARLAGDPSLAPARHALTDLILGWGAAADGLGAALAAMRYDDDAAFGTAMATLIAFVLDRDPAHPIDAELAALRERLAQPLPVDQHPPHVEEVDLAIGRAVRVHAVRDPTAEGEDPQVLRFVVQYWIPLAGRSSTLELEATTSNLALAPEIAAEVDAIVASAGLET